MLEGLWYELVGRSGGWLGVLASAALKAAVILAATALVALALRRASAALRHQVWLVGVASALMVPLLTVVLPRIPVSASWWPNAWSPESAWGGFAGAPPGEWGGAAEAWVEGSEAAYAEMVAAHAGEAAAEAEAYAVAVAAYEDEVAVYAEASPAHWRHGDGATTRIEPVVVVSVGPEGHVQVVPVEPIPPLPAMPAIPPIPPIPPLPSVAYHIPPMAGAFGPFTSWSGPGGPGGPGLPWALGLLAVWLLGAWLVAAGLVVGALRVMWLSWQARPVTDGRCATLARAIADELGLGRIRVLRGSPTAMPMTWGLLRPTVLIPAGAEDWPVDQLDAVLRHELAHARRRDTLAQLVADVACALYWFNPLTWLAAYRLRVEREHACDDEVLASGSKPSDYATQLLDMTRALRTARATAMAAIPMARPSQLRDRLEAVLDGDRRRGRVTRAVAARSWLAAALLVLPVAMLGFVPGVTYADGPPVLDGLPGIAAPAFAWPESEGPAIASTYELARAVYAQSAAVRDMEAAYAAALPSRWQQCGRAGRGRSGTSINVDDDRQRIEWYRDGCRFRVEIDGEVGFDDAFRTIASLSPDGRIRIEGEEVRGERAVEIHREGANLVYRYYEDGREQPFDTAARAWLDGVVLELFRAGYAAEERAAAVLRAGGPQALVQEIDALRTDHVLRIYYQAALTHAGLDDDVVAELIERAGREIRSDYELAEVLIAAADARPVVDGVRDAFIGASASLESDYEQRRVLTRVLSRGDLAPRHVAAMLAAAEGIRSDYDMAELLVALAPRYIDAPELRAAYLETARRIESDYEKRRVLAGVLQQNLSAADAAIVLELVASMSSDYDRAELLTGLATGDMAAPALQRAYIAAAARIGSDFDQRRVLDALLAKERLGSEPLAVLIASTAELSSDHDKAEVLLHIARTQTLTEENRAGFELAVETLRSDYDHGRVASALLRTSR